jgi:hypothetical protein
MAGKITVIIRAQYDGEIDALSIDWIKTAEQLQLKHHTYNLLKYVFTYDLITCINIDHTTYRVIKVILYYYIYHLYLK